MAWRDTPEQAAFRTEARQLSETRLPRRYRKLAAAGELPERAWETDRKSPDPEIRRAATAKLYNAELAQRLAQTAVRWPPTQWADRSGRRRAA